MFRRLEPRSLGDHSPHSALPEDTDVACSSRVGELAFPPTDPDTLWHRPVVLKAQFPDLQHQVRHVNHRLQPKSTQSETLGWAHRSVWPQALQGL